MKKYKPLLIAIILLSAANIISCVSVEAQEETEEGAEINAFIDGKIPSIKVAEWTPIDITVVDAFGIDWDYLKSAVPEFWMRLIWPLNPMFPQPIQRFLGYTSFRFEPEIVEGNPKGWYLRVFPSAIASSNKGDVYKITLEARTDDSAVDYSVVVGIKCIRIDALGGEIGSSYIYIPVKASPTNFVKMRTVERQKKASPKSMVYFTFDITNEGYYKDVFQFELEQENGLMGLLNEQAITLNPGETRKVTLGVLTPEKLWDPGTPNKIDIKVYSVGDPTRTLVGSLIVYTEGIYISPLVFIVLAPIIIVLVIIYLIFFYRREKRYKDLFGKPEKPWTIPLEKKHLEQLKQKDREEYEKERQMMDDEYKSAMLWYESYYDAIKKEEKEKRQKAKPTENKEGFFAGISKKSEKVEKPKKKKTKTVNKKKQKEGNENRLTLFFQKTEKKKPVKKKKVVKPKDVDKIQSQEIYQRAEEQRKKEKALLKIKREQEKQKKKIKK